MRRDRTEVLIGLLFFWSGARTLYGWQCLFLAVLEWCFFMADAYFQLSRRDFRNRKTYDLHKSCAGLSVRVRPNVVCIKS